MNAAMIDTLTRVYPGKVAAPIQSVSFESLYEAAFPAVARFVSKQGGTFTDAKDVFHDAMIIWYEKHRDGFTAQIADEAYILGIAKHLWIRKFNRNKSSVSLDAVEMLIDIPANDLHSEVHINQLVRYLERAGRRCLDLLVAFYYEKMPMRTIRERFQYGSERSATVQKFKCLEKVREEVRKNSLSYEDFIE